MWPLIGDGAFNMTLHDFSASVEYNLPIKIIKIEMEEAGLAPNLEALKVSNFNFAEYAQLVGGEGIRVHHARDVHDVLLMAQRSSKPFIIDAIVNSGELSLSPRIGFKEAKGFGTSKGKELFEALKEDQMQWDNFKKEIEAFFDSAK